MATLCLMGLLGCLLGLAGASVRSCSPQPPVPVVRELRTVQATSSAEVRTVATQSIRVTITRKRPNTASQDGQEGRRNPSAVGCILPKHTAPSIAYEEPYEETISIDAIQSVSAEATSNASIQHSEVSVGSIPPHSNIGVMAGNVPGVVALTYKVVDLPWDCGVDIEANLAQAGVGLSTSGKVFGVAGAYLSYQLQPGLFAGVGVRF